MEECFFLATCTYLRIFHKFPPSNFITSIIIKNGKWRWKNFTTSVKNNEKQIIVNYNEIEKVDVYANRGVIKDFKA